MFHLSFDLYYDNFCPALCYHLMLLQSCAKFPAHPVICLSYQDGHVWLNSAFMLLVNLPDETQITVYLQIVANKKLRMEVSLLCRTFIFYSYFIHYDYHSFFLHLKKVDVKPSKYRYSFSHSSCISICTQHNKRSFFI